MSTSPSSPLPVFPAAWQPVVDQAATALRALALDEAAKERFCKDPALTPFMHRVSQRYVAGHTMDQAVQRVLAINQRGHAASAEYMGESCRDEDRAMAETQVFLDLVAAIGQRDLDCSISFDLSHVGLVVDPELGFRNARRIARAAAEIGREVMISMEGSDRADAIYAAYTRLHTEEGLANVGITVPAKRHRTAADLPALMAIPGRIRLVKGAFLDADDIAWQRNSPQLATAYRAYAQSLLSAGHRCSIATHDPRIQDDLTAYITAHGIGRGQYEFESLIGLGGDQLDALRAKQYPTREYAVFGDEHFLYVLNRIAEEPVRLYQAVVDLLDAT